MDAGPDPRQQDAQILRQTVLDAEACDPDPTCGRDLFGGAIENIGSQFLEGACQVGALDLQMERNRGRITSYNVCYTKLLRLGVDDAEKEVVPDARHLDDHGDHEDGQAHRQHDLERNNFV